MTLNVKEMPLTFCLKSTQQGLSKLLNIFHWSLCIIQSLSVVLIFSLALHRTIQIASLTECLLTCAVQISSYIKFHTTGNTVPVLEDHLHEQEGHFVFQCNGSLLALTWIAQDSLISADCGC